MLSPHAPTARRLGLLLAAGAALLLAARVPGQAQREMDPPQRQDGHLVEWEGWRFRWGIRLREGLVITDVSFQNRPVAKYLGLAEIFVPYHPGQPRPEDFLDGAGRNLAELLPGRDCLPGTICTMFNAEGRPEGRRVVGIHEESTGLLYLADLGRGYGKMLVVWCASRLDGYTYFIRWRFRSDGMIMPDVGLTGRLEHTRPDFLPQRSVVVDRDPAGGTLCAPHHVHNFYYRLDLDIDGPGGDILEELNHRQDVPGRSLASRDTWQALARETSRSLDSAAFRSWRVVDAESRNRLGHRRGYHLHPGGNGVFRGGENEAFAQADLWVTRFRANEFPFSGADPRSLKEALPTYLNQESVNGEDLVLWYCMHVHHHPRSEDWPAMPVEWAGFTLAPRDFLDGPAIQPTMQ